MQSPCKHATTNTAVNVYENITSFPKSLKAAVAIGTFDGVHVGHQQLIRKLCTNSQQIDGETVIVTFWPHPKQVIATSQKAPIQLLTNFSEKVALFKTLSVAHVIKIPFTTTFAQLSAQDFIEQILVARIGTRRLLVGTGQRFGKNRTGNVTLLQAAGAQHGFTVQEVTPTMIDKVTISSTKIRHLLHTGEVEKAHVYLGRPYKIACNVLHKQAAHTQKASLQLTEPSTYKLIPADGHYMVQVSYQNTTADGILHITRNHHIPCIALTCHTCTDAIAHHKLQIRFMTRIQSIAKN